MKIYKDIKIPGLGGDDYDEIWQRGYDAGYESGYTDGLNDCPEPPARLCWLEDLEGNQLIRDVITLPSTGGQVSIKVVCDNEDIIWFLGDWFGPFHNCEGTGTTVVNINIPPISGTGADFYTWQPLQADNADVVPGSAVRFTFEGLVPDVTFSPDFSHSTQQGWTVEEDGDNYYITVTESGQVVNFTIYLISNTAYTVNCREELTGDFDMRGIHNPIEGMGGHHYLNNVKIPFHDTPRRYVFDVYSDDLYISTTVIETKYENN